MIPDRRSSRRGLLRAVSLVAALTVAFSARSLVAAPRSDAGIFSATQITDPVPTRIEGYIVSINGSSWLVDQTRVVRGPQTTVLELRGKAEAGAWVLVAGAQYADRLEADTIEVLRRVGAPGPTYQLTGMLTKQTSITWTIEDTPVDITEDTVPNGDIEVNTLVRVTVRRVDNRFQALEMQAIAPDAAAVPFAIEGVLEKVKDNAWVVDSQPIVMPADQGIEAGEGDTVEVQAVRNETGSLVAQQARLVDNLHDTQLTGFITAVNRQSDDSQTWTVMVFEDGRVEERTVNVTPDTYVDEGRAIIEPQVEARVQGVKSGDVEIDAALIHLERPTPETVQGELTQTENGALWQVGHQPVWFVSDELAQAAAQIAAQDSARPGQSAADAPSADVVVQGLRLSNGVLVAQEVLSATAAGAAGLAGENRAAASAPSLADLEDGWQGPMGINASLSDASKPTMLFDASGSHAVFESAGKIYYTYQGASGTWSERVKIGTGSKPTATFDAWGQLHVAYTSEFMGNYDILHVRRTSTGWTLPTVVAPTTGKSTDPALAGDRTGKVHIAWTDFTSGEWAIQVGQWDGKYWTSYPVPNARGQSPSATVMPDGGLVLAWQDRIPLGGNTWGAYDIFASEYTQPDRTWSLPVNISDNRTFRPESNSLGARLVGTDEGHAHIAWIDDSVQVRYDFGRGLYWPAPVSITDRRPLVRGLDLLQAADGLLYIAWDEGATLRVTASPPRTEIWPESIILATRAASANGGVFDVSLATGWNGVSVSWVQHNVSGDMGVYESRHNMPRVLIKIYLPWLTMP